MILQNEIESLQIKTKNDFYDFIKKTYKPQDDGKYSNETLFKICVLYKYSVPQGEKNWKELAKYLKLNKSGEALRCWTKYKMKAIESIKKQDSSEHEVVDTTNTNKFNCDDVDKKLSTLYKEQTKSRDLLNAYRRTLRDDARIDSLKETISSAIKSLEALPPFKPYTINASHKKESQQNINEAVLLLSDLHMGVQCDNFYNKYNLTIAEQRLSKLAEDVIKYCKATNVDTLHILNLGDMIHGIIHISARVEQQMDVIQQVMEAAELLSRFLTKVQYACPHIIYRSCTDNHSRMIADKNQNIEKENLSKIIDWYLKERLKDSVIDFESSLDDSMGVFHLKNGKACAFAHGHQDSIDKSLQNFVGATKQFIYYAFLGHYHTEKMKSFQGFRVFINGSIVGTEQYALGKRLFSSPSQKLIIFDYNNNCINNTEDIIDISINLEEETK